MPLLCRLGAHRPGNAPVWNHGFYFARCRRCGTDLVRTTYSGWRAPRGYRVSWQTTPPESVVAAEADALAASEARIVEEVVRRLRSEAAPEARRDARRAEAPEARRRAPPPSSIPDFMDEPRWSGAGKG